MVILTDEGKEKSKMVVGVVIGLFVIYLVASAFNLIPGQWNIFEQFRPEPEPILADGEGYIDGIPTEVNITAEENNSFELTFICNESYIDGMHLILTPGDNLTGTEAYFTATSTNWQISSDQLDARYIGDPLTIGVEINDLILHVDGGTINGTVVVEITTTVGVLTPDTTDIVIIAEEV